jgi:hypothetical protein
LIAAPKSGIWPQRLLSGVAQVEEYAAKEYAAKEYAAMSGAPQVCCLTASIWIDR